MRASFENSNPSVLIVGAHVRDQCAMMVGNPGALKFSSKEKIFSYGCKHLVNIFFLSSIFVFPPQLLLTFSAVILPFISLHSSCSKKLRQEMKLLTCWLVLFQSELA